MSAKEIIRSLMGLQLELIDDEILERFSFGENSVIQIFGEKRGNVACVAGPVLEYTITHDGKVEFGFGDGTVRFTWDRIELREDLLIVHCGTHIREHSFTYRPTKHFAIKRNTAA